MQNGGDLVVNISRRKFLEGLVICSVLGVLTGCGGIFAPPYDIDKPPPSENTTPECLVPQNIEGLTIIDRQPMPFTRVGEYSGVSMEV